MKSSFIGTKPGRDGATPSGNGIAAQALILLGHLANDARYLDAAERTVRLFAPTLAQAPSGFASLLTALEDLEAPPTSVLLAGDSHDAHAWHRRWSDSTGPTCTCSIWRRSIGLRRRSSKARSPSAARSRGVQRHGMLAANCFARRRFSGFSPRADEPGYTHATSRAFRLPSDARFIQFRQGKANEAWFCGNRDAHAGGRQSRTPRIDTAAAEAMMKKDGCSACHAVDKKIIGPSYQEVSAKYKGDKDAAAKLVKKVKEGGSGVWGQVPMPPNVATPDADVKALVDWILTLKK
jgi:cytochrome c